MYFSAWVKARYLSVSASVSVSVFVSVSVSVSLAVSIAFALAMYVSPHTLSRVLISHARHSLVFALCASKNVSCAGCLVANQPPALPHSSPCLWTYKLEQIHTK